MLGPDSEGGTKENGSCLRGFYGDLTNKNGGLINKNLQDLINKKEPRK